MDTPKFTLRGGVHRNDVFRIVVRDCQKVAELSLVNLLTNIGETITHDGVPESEIPKMELLPNFESLSACDSGTADSMNEESRRQKGEVLKNYYDRLFKRKIPKIRQPAIS